MSDQPGKLDPTADERRRASRAVLVTFAWYQIIREAGTDQPGESGISQSCDVSESGVGLLTARPLEPGARVFLELSTSVGSLSAVAEVANCNGTSDGRYRVGLRLLVIPPSDRESFDRIAGR